MTKQEMEDGMVIIYDKYHALFVSIQVKKITFLEWINSFGGYDEHRKAYKFMSGRMLKALIPVYALWAHHSDEAWANLFVFSRDAEDVIKIKDHLRDVKLVWNRRPKAKRRPANLL